MLPGSITPDPGWEDRLHNDAVDFRIASGKRIGGLEHNWLTGGYRTLTADDFTKRPPTEPIVDLARNVLPDHRHPDTGHATMDDAKGDSRPA